MIARPRRPSSGRDVFTARSERPSQRAGSAQLDQVREHPRGAVRDGRGGQRRVGADALGGRGEGASRGRRVSRRPWPAQGYWIAQHSRGPGCRGRGSRWEDGAAGKQPGPRAFSRGGTCPRGFFPRWSPSTECPVRAITFRRKLISVAQGFFQKACTCRSELRRARLGAGVRAGEGSCESCLPAAGGWMGGPESARGSCKFAFPPPGFPSHL